MLDGIACFDRWAREFGTPARQLGGGDRYCYGIYRRTHRSAAGYLREIATNHPGITGYSEAAASFFEREADALDTAEKDLG